MRSEPNTVLLINAVMLVRRHPGCCDVIDAVASPSWNEGKSNNSILM